MAYLQLNDTTLNIIEWLGPAKGTAQILNASRTDCPAQRIRKVKPYVQEVLSIFFLATHFTSMDKTHSMIKYDQSQNDNFS